MWLRRQLGGSLCVVAAAVFVVCTALPGAVVPLVACVPDTAAATHHFASVVGPTPVWWVLGAAPLVLLLVCFWSRVLF